MTKIYQNKNIKNENQENSKEPVNQKLINLISKVRKLHFIKSNYVLHNCRLTIRKKGQFKLN